MSVGPPISTTATRPSDVPLSYHVAADGTLRRNVPVSEINRIIGVGPAEEGEGVLWVDVDVTNRHHLAVLENACRFHPLTIEDTLNPNSRVKVEEFPGYLFSIIRGVRFFAETDDPYDLETFNLCFYLGPRFVVTVHAGPSPAIEAVTDRVERSPDLLRRGADRLLHSVMDAAIDAYFPLLDQIDEFATGLEERVFEKFDRAAMRDIFAVRRAVLTLRRHLGPQREVFNILSNRPSALLSSEGQVYFRDIYDHVLRIADATDMYRDLLTSTMESYLTQVSNRLGSVTKALSIVATLSIPFVVISGMWGMNFQYIPLADSPHAFWIMLGIQLGAGFLLVLVLRLLRLI